MSRHATIHWLLQQLASNLLPHIWLTMNDMPETSFSLTGMNLTDELQWAE